MRTLTPQEQQQTPPQYIISMLGHNLIRVEEQSDPEDVRVIDVFDMYKIASVRLVGPTLSIHTIDGDGRYYHCTSVAEADAHLAKLCNYLAEVIE